MKAREYYKKKYGVEPGMDSSVLMDMKEILDLQDEFAEQYHKAKLKEFIEKLGEEFNNIETDSDFTWNADIRDILTKLKELNK